MSENNLCIIPKSKWWKVSPLQQRFLQEIHFNNSNNNNNNNNNNNGLISVHPWYGSSPDIKVK